MQAMSLNFALAQKENKCFTTCNIKAETRAIDMRVIFHVNDIVNDL